MNINFQENLMTEDAVKFAIIEQKLVAFDSVITKIDDAIAKISDVNTNITKMLAVHNERIDQCNKTDQLVVKMIDDLKYDNAREHKEVTTKISEIETKVDEFTKFRWIAAGVMAVIIFVAPIFTNHISNVMSHSYNQNHKIK